MSSHWEKWITRAGHIRVVALDASALARELAAIQSLDSTARLGLAEAVAGALLIASSHKSNESINLNAKGSKHFRQAIVDASPDGFARGFLIVNDADPTPEWGEGVLSILYTKNFEGKTPYTGMVAIAALRLEAALNDYYRDSEQLGSRLGLFVTNYNGALVTRGVLLQALGGATAEEIARLEVLSVADVHQLAEFADRSEEFERRAAALLGGRALEKVERRELKSFCTCSLDRIERALLLTGEADTKDALGRDPYLEIICDFCRTEYRVTAERVAELFRRDPSRLQ